MSVFERVLEDVLDDPSRLDMLLLLNYYLVIMPHRFKNALRTHLYKTKKEREISYK